MFKNEYFEVEKLLDDVVLIMNRQRMPYKWSEKATHCYCPAYNKEVSPFLMVRYSDNTWSLCHAEAGPMPEATYIPEIERGVCPIVFYEDFLEEKEIKQKDSCFKKILKGLVSLGTVITGHKKINQKVTENGVGDINIQHMMGIDKHIENYERMVGNLFEGQRQTHQKIVSHVSGIPVVHDPNVRK